jgi:predicted site-specific integrase-resolvase
VVDGGTFHHLWRRTPVAHTLGTAAHAAGVSKSTLRRAIEKGRLSATRREDGSYEIDPAELARVFPRPSADTAEMARPDTTGDTGGLQREVALLREVVEDLRRRLDASEAERRQAQERLTALLTDQRPPKRRKWWPWG